jgi:hypothetical protein
MNIVLDLLWLLLLWHSLAKLRLHTESTVNILEGTGSQLGRAARRFAKECEEIETYELPSEVGARLRRDARNNAKRQEKSAPSTKEGKKIPSTSASGSVKASKAGGQTKGTRKGNSIRH